MLWSFLPFDTSWFFSDKHLISFWNEWVTCLLTVFSASSSLQFDPAPRRGEPHVTRRTPDYFLWMSTPSLVNHLESSAPSPPTPPLSFGWKFLNNLTVPGRIETHDWLKNPDFNEETLERPPLQSCFQYAVINAVLLGKTTMICFFSFCLIHVLKTR